MEMDAPTSQKDTPPPLPAAPSVSRGRSSSHPNLETENKYDRSTSYRPQQLCSAGDGLPDRRPREVHGASRFHGGPVGPAEITRRRAVRRHAGHLRRRLLSPWLPGGQPAQPRIFCHCPKRASSGRQSGHANPPRCCSGGRRAGCHQASCQRLRRDRSPDHSAIQSHRNPRARRRAYQRCCPLHPPPGLRPRLRDFGSQRLLCRSRPKGARYASEPGLPQTGDRRLGCLALRRNTDMTLPVRAVDAMTDMNAAARDNSNDGSTPGGGDDADRLGPGIWKIIAVAVAGAFMPLLSTTMVNVSLLNLAAELHASLSTIQWVTSGYLLALALMLPLNGWLVERIGAKALYLWCFSAFTLSSALCGIAWSANALIAFRILQGLSGGLMAPMTQMMIARAAGKHMARVIGYAAVPVMLGPLLGPVIAGAILQHASWRWLFLINLPVGALAIVLAIL